MSQIHAGKTQFGVLPLLSLRAFEAAGRRLSFQQGAAEIGITPSAVSHHVRLLESALGTRLFDRNHQSVALTEAGADLARVVGQSLGAIAAAYDAVKTSRGPMTVSAAPLFAARWLLPALKALHQQRIELRVDASSLHADVAGGACDIAIRLGPRPARSLAAEALVASASVLVASKDRMAGRERLEPHEIAAGPLLGLHMRPGFWTAALKVLAVAPGPWPEITFDSLDAALRAAQEGIGIAYAPEIVVADRVGKGELRIAYPQHFRTPGWNYWFVARPEVFNQSAVSRLRTWLKAEVAKPLR